MAVRASTAPPDTPSDVAAFYRARRFRPVWFDGAGPTAHASALLGALAGAANDGLDPERYHLQRLSALLATAQRSEPSAVARADVALTIALADYAQDLHRPAPEARMALVDPRLPQPPDRRLVLADPRRADMGARLAAVQRMHPAYLALRRALIEHRAASSDRPRSWTERKLLANLERARALPPDPGPRYLLVDAAAARLWVVENGRAVDSMKVVVGTPSLPTPMMAAVLRYAVANPYWNLPPDIVRDRIVPAVLTEGPQGLERRDMEALSGSSPDSQPLDPAAVDWPSVADGRLKLRVRQRPGPRNTLGAVKFMAPNRLGIYLHDTPDKAVFTGDKRWLSAGCVRLEDAERLGRWLYGGPLPVSASILEQRIDLPRPTPVYITYFTVAPRPEGGVEFRRDVYGRDPPLTHPGG